MFVYDENKNPLIWNLLLSFNKIKLLFSKVKLDILLIVLVILDNNEIERWKSFLINLNIKAKISNSTKFVWLLALCFRLWTITWEYDISHYI